MQHDFEAIELDKRETLPFEGSEIQHALGEITGATTVSQIDSLEGIINKTIRYPCYFQVPRVFVNGQFIGGGTDVKKLNESGQLKKLLE